MATLGASNYTYACATLRQTTADWIGAQVQALRNGWVSGARRLQSVGAGDRTDDQGTYRIFSLPPGEYLVTATLRDERPMLRGGPAADLPDPRQLTAASELKARGAGWKQLAESLLKYETPASKGFQPPRYSFAGLLHDTLEDTLATPLELEQRFGKDVVHLVDGVTKLDKVTWGEAAKAETVRKMVVAMARDIRVLVIKLADRLHNARTWKYVSRESASAKAQETLEIYAPLAHRLGMNTIKWELEDLSFKTLYPKLFEEIRRQVSERAG